jgi:Flp pilus assembly protein TadG
MTREWNMGKHTEASRRDRGAALVETAIILPILLLLTFGIWSTARAWNVRNTMEHSAREAVRFASTELPWSLSSESAVRDVVDAELAGSSIPPAAVQSVCIGQGAAPCSFGATTQGYNQVAVELSWPDYTLEFLFFSVDVDLAVQAVGRYEG